MLMLIRKHGIISTVLVVLILTTALSVYIISKRVDVYSHPKFSHPYDVNKDYEYSFSGQYANIINLALKNGKVTLPKLDDSNYSAFIKLNLDTTFLGGYFEPSITIISQNKNAVQYFASGAKGVRYINITSLVTKGRGEIEFKGKYINLKDQGIELILYKHQDIRKTTLLVVAPHPDDAEIAAYGLYSSNSERSYIVTVTAGDAGYDNYDEVYADKVKQYLKKGELRTWNSITVPMLGGVPPERSINLGFFDGKLESMDKNKSKEINSYFSHTSDINTFRKQNISRISLGLTGKANWESLVKNFVYLLKKIKPGIIVTPYPALDRHMDHKLSSVALFEAIKKAGIKDGSLYMYTNHYVLNEYYPYGKMGGVVSLPPNFNKPIYFDSIYSHTLPISTQKDKIFALEAMNDLRPDTEWRFSTGAIRLALHNIKRDIEGQDFSYYRRAVRSNELFFVININDIYNEKKLKKIMGSKLYCSETRSNSSAKLSMGY